MTYRGDSVITKQAGSPDNMSDADFNAFSELIHKETGIVISAAKRSMLISRLSRRIRSLGLKDFSSYRALLDDEVNVEERRKLISVITTNVTSFFREPTHFSELVNMVPSFATRIKKGDRIRIWSAGCSSGEEPYSIAMTLVENWPDCKDADVRILATDIDPEMVECARAGRYHKQQLGEEPHNLIRKYFLPTSDGSVFQASNELQNLLRFEELNLIHPWPFSGKFDVIFCRNVVIYFDSKTRQQLWRRFAEKINPGGTLFIGHSERVDTDLEQFLKPCGVTQYQRTNVHVVA